MFFQAADNALCPEYRQRIFPEIGKLLESFGRLWGVNLVHTHCTLAEGEVMLARGNVSQPEPLSNEMRIYPERWLSDGRAFEFTTEYTESPPPELLEKFRELIGNYSGVLGLYYAGSYNDQPDATIILEHTDGRKNITNVVSAACATGNTQTAWLPDGSGALPVQMACTLWCDTRNTRNGSVHKGTQSHQK
ncbi:hypothetical protein K435DRAFT_974760 [Dendrothele bispora CBS 962.96]|uniref:Uncharacterized protein n=1 Tax=Dendrothele bispora (strain CBS 962.96) TaxID=1314807 RepID=A0A4S8KJD9_DENBC|nr:hypothetical protein K435DRAFT_974760 [Dendrothele bispora CBS 962.96]